MVERSTLPSAVSVRPSQSLSAPSQISWALVFTPASPSSQSELSVTLPAGAEQAWMTASGLPKPSVSESL